MGDKNKCLFIMHEICFNPLLYQTQFIVAVS